MLVQTWVLGAAQGATRPSLLANNAGDVIWVGFNKCQRIIQGSYMLRQRPDVWVDCVWYYTEGAEADYIKIVCFDLGLSPGL